MLTGRSFSKATKRTPSRMCSTTSANRAEKRTLESQSNGIAARAVQDLEGVRTHQLDLAAKLKTTVRIGHLCTAWMVENVADFTNKCKFGQDSP